MRATFAAAILAACEPLLVACSPLAHAEDVRPTMTPSSSVLYDAHNSTALFGSGTGTGTAASGRGRHTAFKVTSHTSSAHTSAPSTQSSFSFSSFTNGTNSHSTGAVHSTGRLNPTGVIHHTSKNPKATHTGKSSQKSSSSSSDDDPFMMHTTASGSSNATATSSGDASAPTFASFGTGDDDDNGMPVYNLGNTTCDATTTMNGSVLWETVEGDKVVKKLNDMLQMNQLTCLQCFGEDKSSCKDKSSDCSTGLRDLATDDQKEVRWDRAAARFSRDADIRDWACELGNDNCDAAPNCVGSDGPGAWAVLKSVTVMYSSLNVVYKAIGEARNRASLQMDLFSSTFAPLPSIKEEAMMLTILTAIACGMLGFIPGVGGVIAGTLAGVGSGVMMEEFFFNLPTPVDTGSYLGTFVNVTQEAYLNVAEDLFRSGAHSSQSQDGKRSSNIRMEDLMKGGALMDQSSDPDDFFNALVPTYERIILQQLTSYTWSYLEKDDSEHIPFIAFDNKPCKDVDSNADGSLAKITGFSGVGNLDTMIDYEGKCYYLLDGKVEERTTVSRGGGSTFYICTPGNALPGGTNKSLKDNSDEFAGLSLGDFIIPAVKGWEGNHNQNDYALASADGKLVADPQDAGAVKIPVCDYAANAQNPGIDCPMINARVSPSKKRCGQYAASTGTNQPGDYQNGWCRLHFEQFQRNEGNVNPLDQFQMSVTVFDDSSRAVGQAPKQPAGSPLEVVDTSLPFHLIAAAGAGDDDPVQFWYSDQYWDSNSKDNKCSVGSFDDKSHSRQGDCGFNCPLLAAGDSPPVSAVDAHPLPTPAVKAVGGPSSFVNTFMTSTTVAPAHTTTSAVPTPTYATGSCGFHIRQYQKNEGDENPTGDYMLEVTIFDAKQKAIGASGKVSAKQDKPVTVNGLVMPFYVTAQAVDSDPLKIAYGDDKFDTSTSTCSVGKYDSGARDMDCGLKC